MAPHYQAIQSRSLRPTYTQPDWQGNDIPTGYRQAPNGCPRMREILYSPNGTFAEVDPSESKQ